MIPTIQHSHSGLTIRVYLIAMRSPDFYENPKPQHSWKYLNYISFQRFFFLQNPSAHIKAENISRSMLEEIGTFFLQKNHLLEYNIPN